MLESLSIRDYVLIDQLDLEFENGFSCITGETGSGKSIILGALSLLLGGKADRDSIRSGAGYAQISGCFADLSDSVCEWCEQHGIIVEDRHAAINRIIKANGRSVYTVNGVPVTRSDGAALGAMLVDIASQHASQSLMRDDVLLAMLDAASGSGQILSDYKESYSEYMEQKRALKELQEGIEKDSEEQEYLRYCINELEKADLKPGEEEELRERASVLGSAEAIAESVHDAIERLGCASEAASEALSMIDRAARKDNRLTEFRDRLDSDIIDIDDVLLSLKEYVSRISFSENELDSVNSRLSEIQKIKHRFGGSVDRAIGIRDEYRERLSACEKKDELLSSLSDSVGILRDRAEELASSLSSMRKEGAKRLSILVEDNLHVLGMASSKFIIRVQDTGVLASSGCDDVSFRIIANKGEKESDIQNSSSGGELSRILLAIKAALGMGDSSIAMLFDEIDSGLGGVVANSVADKLCELSEKHQVLAITHLAQIAVRASAHYLVYKEEIDGRTVSRIRRIEGGERVSEIARLLSGDESSISMEHARALLDESMRRL